MDINATEIVQNANGNSKSSTAPLNGQEATTIEAKGDKTIPVNDPLGKRLEIIMNRERDALSKIREAEERLKQVTEKESALSKWKQFEDITPENLFEFLQAKGLDYETVTKSYLSKAEDQDLDPTLKKLKELEQKLESQKIEYEKMLEEKMSKDKELQEQTALENQISQEKEKIGKFILSNKEKFELLGAEENPQEAVWEVLLESHKAGKTMNPEEACTAIEGYLEQKYKEVLQLSKIKKLLGTSDESTGSELERAAEQWAQRDMSLPSGKTHTIDHDMVGRTPAKSHELDDDQRIAAATQVFQKLFGN